MTLILDAGAFINVDSDLMARIKGERKAGRVPKTHACVVAQVWRGDARQALLAKLLQASEVEPIDAALGRRSGLLLARAGTHDPIDAALVLLAADGDEIVTSDTDDIAHLARTAQLHVDLNHI